MRAGLKVNILSNKDKAGLSEVISLADKNRATLGFLPQEVFKKYSQEGKVIIAKDADNLAGYILYRTTSKKNRAAIVHLCIANEYRGHGVTLLLLEKLFKVTSSYSGIGLSCRNDYYANQIWGKYGFVDSRERVGRSKEGKPLTFWWRKNPDAIDLFSELESYQREQKISCCLDYCVVLDLIDNRSKESEALLQDWLAHEVEFFYTPEIYPEIQRASSDLKSKNRKREFLDKWLKPITYEAEFLPLVAEELHKLKQSKDDSDVSDLNHLSYAISGSSNYFVTNDQTLIKTYGKYVECNYGLKLLTPGEFILSIDEITSGANYQPSIVSTRIIRKRRFNSDDSKLLHLFQNSQMGEKVNRVQSLVREAIAHKNVYDVEIYYNHENEVVGLIVTKHIESKINVELIRFSKSKLQETFSKNILYKIMHEWSKESNKITQIKDPFIQSTTIKMLSEFGFVEQEGKVFSKILLKGIYKQAELLPTIMNIPGATSSLARAILTHSQKVTNSQYSNYILEKMLWPVKLEQASIPCYIIPIQPKWAKRLFDEQALNNELYLSDRPDLILNRENVYYKSKHPKIEPYSRIVWYVSQGKSKDPSGACVKAVSYVTNVRVDNPKMLFNEYKDIGIYEWTDLMALTQKDVAKEIMAFKFVDTEMFSTPITYNHLRRVYSDFCNKNLSLQTALKIDEGLFLKLYSIGMKL